MNRSTTHSDIGIEDPGSREEQSLGKGFVITYGAADRIWHDVCGKAEPLPNLSTATVERYQAANRCGSRTSPWTSRGSS